MYGESHFVKRGVSLLLSLSLLSCQSIYIPHSSADEETKNLISLDVKNMDINNVLKIIAEQGGLNIISSKNVRGNISARVKNLPIEQALKEILEINRFVYEEDSGLIKVMTEQEHIARYGKRPGDEMKIFVLKYADISKLAPLLNQVKTKTGKIVPDFRTNTLVVIDTPESVAHIESMIGNLDVELVPKTFALKHAEAAKIVAGLQKVVSKGGTVQVDVRTNKITVRDVASNVELISEMIREWDVPTPTITRAFVLKYAKPEEIKANVEKELTRGVGIVQVDERTSTIVVTDRPEKVEKITSLISTLDTKTKQILIEVKMVETTLSDEQKLGIDWQYQTPETRPQEHRRDLRGDFSQGISTGGIFKIGMLGKEEYAMTLEMLRDTGDTNIIANPSLITLNNQTAKIVVGTEYPVATYQLVQETGTYEITGWDLLEYGITVEVTPAVNEDGFITMTIHPVLSDAVGTVGDAPHERPVIETQEVTTQTMIKDGETVVIAGLLKDKRQKSVKKIPLLGSIPILGLLFRKTSDEASKTDLLIFITAHVIESGKESVNITSKGRAQKRKPEEGRGSGEDKGEGGERQRRKNGEWQ